MISLIEVDTMYTDVFAVDLFIWKVQGIVGWAQPIGKILLFIYFFDFICKILWLLWIVHKDCSSLILYPNSYYIWYIILASKRREEQVTPVALKTISARYCQGMNESIILASGIFCTFSWALYLLHQSPGVLDKTVSCICILVWVRVATLLSESLNLPAHGM